jgi:hypothetical protein
MLCIAAQPAAIAAGGGCGVGVEGTDTLGVPVAARGVVKTVRSPGPLYCRWQDWLRRTSTLTEALWAEDGRRVLADPLLFERMRKHPPPELEELI